MQLSALCESFACWRSRGYRSVPHEGSEPGSPALGVGESFCEVRTDSLEASTATPSTTSTGEAASPGAAQILAKIQDELDMDASPLCSPSAEPELTPSAPLRNTPEQATPEEAKAERAQRRKRALSAVLQQGSGSVFRDVTNAPPSLTPIKSPGLRRGSKLGMKTSSISSPG